MSKYLLVFFVFFFYCGHSQILNPDLYVQKEWKVNPFSQKYFVENKGQWKNKQILNQPVLVAYDGQNEDYFFSKNAIQIELIKKKWKKEEERYEQEKEREEEYTLVEKRESITSEWLNTHPNAQVFYEEKNSFYSSYSFKEGNQVQNINYIPTYNKVVYKNIYPNIDIEYTLHPDKGYKYTIIVHPGGKVSDIKWKYSKKTKIKDNQVFVFTALGEIIEHTPVAYLQNTKKNVACKYAIDKNSILSFYVDAYPSNETLIIDPWTQTPNFPSTNWDCVWECERDGAGNVYIIGGTSPMQLIKYNSAGALQWTYNTPYDTTSWLGTFAVDNAGNSYITQGSVAQIQKVSTAGGLVWNNTSPVSTTNGPEFWNITFNCNQTKLVVAGTRLPLLSTAPQPFIYQIDMNTGNVTNSVQVTGVGSLGNEQEVRSITSCSNSTYYYLTHDSIGYVSDNLSPCGSVNTFPFHVNSGLNLSYKCENFRKNNCGLEAIAFSNFNGFVYVNAGNQVQKRNFNTGAIVGTAAIPGGSFSGGFGGNAVGNSGIAIDNCGNVYVGSTNGVYKFDQNLNLLGSYPTSFNVYDVEVNSGGEIIAAGSTGNSGSASRTGYVQTFAASACAPQSMICCDPNICPVTQKCQSDPPFTFSVSTPGGTFSASCGSCINSSTGSFSPSISGTGTFVVTYSLSCGSQTTQVVVAPCSTLNVCSQPSGSLQVSGGTPSYTWAYQTTSVNCSSCIFGCNVPPGCSVTVTYWANYATGTVAPAPPNYPIRITDATGSTVQINSAASITPCVSCPTIVITPTIQNALCNGGTGSCTVSASGGTGPYTYTWMPGSLTGSVQSNLNPGTVYTVIAKDNNACTGTVTLSITQPAAITSTITTQNATCTAANGNATISVTGGTSPYTYTWLPSGGNSNIANNLTSGNYSVLVKDANNCLVTFTTTIGTSTALINTSVNIQNASCSTPGSATVMPSGGFSPYTYTWIPIGGSASVATGLSIGNYTVNISDSYGCTTFTTLTIGGTGIAVAGIQTQSVSCNGGSNGSATVSITGGTTPYSYTWAPSVSTSSIASNLVAGNYTVYIQDNASCTASTVVNITQASAFTITVNSSSVSCYGGSNGSATVNVSGGNPTYSYTWIPSGGNANVTNNLSAGIYTVLISDITTCTSVASVSVTQASSLNVSVTSTNNCGGNATATVNVTGGTSPYSYTWSPIGGNSQVASNLPPGIYTVFVSDAHNCTSSANFTVSASNLSYTITTDSADCFGSATGSATINIQGGVAPYTYTWLPSGGNSNVAVNLGSGSYSVIVNDASGCNTTVTLNIFQPNNIILNVSPSTSVCVNNTVT
ncbi:MAG: SprB repeat-containing protein [Bacteroidia bacterium]|nr:SprB repeat-containing protein [Bacteroidia bacterium]